MTPAEIVADRLESASRYLMKIAKESGEFITEMSEHPKNSSMPNDILIPAEYENGMLLHEEKCFHYTWREYVPMIRAVIDAFQLDAPVPLPVVDEAAIKPDAGKL